MNKLITLLTILIALTSCDSGGGGSAQLSGSPKPDPIIPAIVEKGKNFVTFETGQVRPLAKSPDGTKLFALNTPNSTLEIFDITPAGLTFSATVTVGMEPTAVAALTNNIVWVVNHLSDSVSIIDVSGTPKVIQTLLVGDEPRDIIFAGAANKFAFITTAHRGQNAPNDIFRDPQLTTPGIGRADVWVFDTTKPGTTIGGDPVNVISLFGDTPRALTRSPDGNTVYVAVFFSGNKTTTLGEDNLNKPAPTISSDGATQPDTGLIVQFNGTNWVDAQGNTSTPTGANAVVTYDSKVKFSLPDYDVFSIDASVAIPVAIANGEFSGVGTTLFNMITDANGTVYVSNTNALNLTRFEGTRALGSTVSTVRGHYVESQITVIKNNTVMPVRLNNHIDYTKASGSQIERDFAISQPVDMAINGTALYVAGFGTQNVVVYDTTKLDAGTNDQLQNPQIKLSAGGPSGIVYLNNKLYVLTRFDNGISVIDTIKNTETSHTKMYNPEPVTVTAGRQFLYNATVTSSHGDSSCGLCHVYGDFDGLAWDLGDPTGAVATNPNEFVIANTQLGPIDLKPANPVFHPMKGPMTTQSFRGLKGNGPMHWRGDRVGASAKAGESIELGAFKDFNVAIKGLVGNDNVLLDSEMQAFAEFALEITYPPNPIRNLNNTLTAEQEAGRLAFLNDGTTANGLITCNDCHVLDTLKNNFGTSGKSSTEGPEISQENKVPHLRNMYQKVGKFGNSGKFSSDLTNYGPQIKGFGFMTDGGMDTIDKFIQGGVFRTDIAGNVKILPKKRRQIEDFIMAMDSELAPIVGQQITLNGANSNNVKIQARINLLRDRAQEITPRAECDLIVKGVIAGVSRGYLMNADGSYQSDIKSEIISDTNLRALVAVNNQTLTFTCVPPGSGLWMGIDHDEDGKFDQDEVLSGANPLMP
ncbi:MAG: hypothetical protein ACC653_04715 [Gammaproteobacteria bacterium]